MTVLANMSGVEICCDDLVDSDAPRLLVSFLHISPPPATEAATQSELAAFEHVQQKSAIAITRLARDPDTAQTIINLKGILEHNSVVEKALLSFISPYIVKSQVFG